MKPAEYHTDWLGNRARREYEIGLLKKMRISWVVMMTNGDSAIEVIDGKEAVRWLLDEGIVPIIRDDSTKLPQPYNNQDFVRRLVAIYTDYGLRPTIIPWNEPGDTREWKNGVRPANWREVFLALFLDAARQIREVGANWAFPDPLGKWDWWFPRFPSEMVEDMRAGVGLIAAHLYGKARDIIYPEDEVSRYGVPLDAGTYEAYKKTSPFDPPPLASINHQRREWADPQRTFLDDHTCFGAWRNIYYHFIEAHHFRPVMCMTEGGWTPDDRAGTDIRFLATTPHMVADKTVQMFNADTGMYAVCPWLAYGWSHDGWWYNGLCLDNNGEQPVIEALAGDPLDDALVEIEAARGILNDLLETRN
jgi:hypothetical protein